MLVLKMRLPRSSFLVIRAAFLTLMLSLLALTAGTPALAQSPEGATGMGPGAGSPAGGRAYDEAVAQGIDRMLMCPVCPGETIDQAQVELARQMRLRVREMLAQGSSRQEVLDFFVDRYGAGILAAPPKSGFSLLAWTFPAVAVPAALAAGLLALRAMRRRTGPSPDPGLPSNAANAGLADAGLDPFLDRVDRELAGPDTSGREGAASDG